MTDAHTPPAADRPAHYRLSTVTWEIILREYREGATAVFLADKWRVSLHAIRKRITQHGATKRDWGDAQAIAQAQARAAAMEEAALGSPEARAARLFEGLEGEVERADDAADPAALMKLATRASGRAMTGRLWAEAKALAGLAESYARLAEKAAPKPGGVADFDIDTVDIDVLMTMLGSRDRVEARFAAVEGDPDSDDRTFFWLPIEEKRARIHQLLDEAVARDEAQAAARAGREAQGDHAAGWVVPQANDA